MKFKPNTSQAAMLIAAAENGRADERLDTYNKIHNESSDCPCATCKP